MRWRLRGRRGPGDAANAELDARLSDTWEAAAAAVGKMLDLPAGNEALLASSGRSREGTADPRAPAGMIRGTPRRRRPVLRSVAGVAAMLAAAAVALAVMGVPGGTGPAVDTSYVVKRVESALSAAGPGEIAQLTITTSDGGVPGGTAATAEEWSYGDRWRAVAYTAAGHPVYDEGLSGSSVYTWVSYPTRTWADLQVRASSAPLVPGSHGCEPVAFALPVLFQPGLPGPGSAASAGPATVARTLRAAVSCGSLAVAGRQRVAGADAIELTSGRGSPFPETIWVSPDSYLPVRVVTGPNPAKPGSSRQTVEITWLPPTTQNLAKLTVPIPAGYRQVTDGLPPKPK